MSKSNPTPNTERLECPAIKLDFNGSYKEKGGGFSFWTNGSDDQQGFNTPVDSFVFIPLDESRFCIMGFNKNSDKMLTSREYSSQAYDKAVLCITPKGQSKNVLAKGTYKQLKDNGTLQAIGAKFQKIVYGYAVKINGKPEKQLIALNLSGSAFSAWVDFVKGSAPQDLKGKDKAIIERLLGKNYNEAAYGEQICNYFVVFNKANTRLIENPKTVDYKIPSFQKIKIDTTQAAQKQLDDEAIKVDSETLQPYLKAYDEQTKATGGLDLESESDDKDFSEIEGKAVEPDNREFPAYQPPTQTAQVAPIHKPTAYPQAVTVAPPPVDFGESSLPVQQANTPPFKPDPEDDLLF